MKLYDFLKKTGLYDIRSVSPLVGTGGDDTGYLQTAMDRAYALGLRGVALTVPALLLAAAEPATAGTAGRALLLMRPGISLVGLGAGLAQTAWGPGNSIFDLAASYTTITLSGGRTNPASMFRQSISANPSIGDITVQGIIFDGNYQNQTQTGGYQYGHAFDLHSGDYVNFYNCGFRNFWGDGISTGQPFQSSPATQINNYVKVRQCEFKNIYREAIFMVSTRYGGLIEDCYFHGDGYRVGAIDIERHGMLEYVTNVAIRNNVFDFTDGYRPTDTYTDGRSVRWGRAIAFGFYDSGSPFVGYTTSSVDGMVGNHLAYGNTFNQCGIDIYNHVNIDLVRNTMTATFEDITNATRVTPHMIYASGQTGSGVNGGIPGLSGINLYDNSITTAMAGYGTRIDRYEKGRLIGNTYSTSGSAKGATALPTSGSFLVV